MNTIYDMYGNILVTDYTSSKSVFVDADLSNANLQNMSFFRQDFSGANFHNADLSYSTFTACDFTGTNLSNSHMLYTTMTNCNLTTATIIGCCTTRTNFNNCNFYNADCREISAFSCNFTECNLFEARITDSHLALKQSGVIEIFSDGYSHKIIAWLTTDNKILIDHNVWGQKIPLNDYKRMVMNNLSNCALRDKSLYLIEFIKSNFSDIQY